jgi:hypothetical protein
LEKGFYHVECQWQGVVENKEVSVYGLALARATRDEIQLPLKGQLSYFTEVLSEWLQRLPNKDSYIIPAASGFGMKRSINWNKPLSKAR